MGKLKQVFGKKRMMVYTVTIIDVDDPMMKPWETALSSRAKAMDFMKRVEEKLPRDVVEGGFVDVTLDAGPMNDEQYLDWIDQRWGEDEDEEDE